MSASDTQGGHNTLHQRINAVCIYVDFDVGSERLDSKRDAGDETRSADGHQNSVYIGHLLHYLETTRALAGQNVRVIVTAANILTTSFSKIIMIVIAVVIVVVMRMYTMSLLTAYMFVLAFIFSLLKFSL